MLSHCFLASVIFSGESSVDLFEVTFLYVMTHFFLLPSRCSLWLAFYSLTMMYLGMNLLEFIPLEVS